MLNLGKKVYWQHRLKKFFPNGLMSVKSLVYNKLARQNIYFFINSVSIVVVLTYCYQYSYSYSSHYYYHYYFYYFIIIVTISFCYHSHHYYCSQYYQCYLFYFISFYSLLFILLWLLSVCWVWRVYFPSSPRNFLLMIYILHSRCLYMSRIIFLLSLLFISTLASSQSFYLFLNTTSHWRRIQQMKSSGIVYIYTYCNLFFGEHRRGVDHLFHIYHMASFNYDAKMPMDVGLCCRCHLSNSQLLSSV